ncbi:MAG: thioredoxin family protein [bacterium]
MRLLTLAILWGLSATTVAAEIPAPDVPASAMAVGSVDKGDPRVEVRLIADHDSVAPGQTVLVGVLFHIDPEWHVYWRNSGESGMATDIALTAPAWSTGPMHWPAPTVFVDKSGQVATFGYSDAELLWFDTTVPADAAGEVDLSVEVNWLSCKVECIPGDANLTTRVRVGESARSAHAGIFADAQTRLPSDPGPTQWNPSVAVVHRGESVTATLKMPEPVTQAAALRYSFIPDETPGIAWTTTSVDGDTLTLEGTATRDAFKAPCALSGVIWTATGAKQVRHAVECSNDQPNAAAPTATSSPAAPTLPDGSLAYFLLLAFLGGMLLNLMPCVFPVLALKAFAVVKNAHSDRRTALAHAAAYTAGIVASMLALAGLVVALKVAGTQVGWGFQFQEPWFLVGLSAVLTAFAVNLFGVFEITFSTSLKPKSDGLGRSAAEGVLAVVLATPCSAPLLGTAVGFALSSSAPVIFATFGLLGLGLASPFVMMSAFPTWAKRLPKPGPWMDHFKKVLGFTLLATVIWLLWLIGQVLGADATSRTMVVLLSVALGCWIVGLTQFRSTRARLAGLVIAVALVVAAAQVLPSMQPTERVAQKSGIWQPWSHDRVAQELAAGKTVFVDFTADWCITCKVNENGVLADPEVVDLLTSPDVVALKADWTLRDDVIRQELQRYGKAGVPLYLVHKPGHDGRALPELLTKSMVIEALTD